MLFIRRFCFCFAPSNFKLFNHGNKKAVFEK